MSTRYIQMILDGGTPSIEDWNDHLIAFHRRYSEATSGPMSIFRTDAGETSYELLTRRVRELVPHAASILDVGCGDGFLLRNLRSAFPLPTELIGIDLCDAEIERARLAELDNVVRHCGDVHDIDLGAARHDAIVSHLSFLSISGLGELLRKFRIALRGCGLLAFVVESPADLGSLMSLLGAGLAALRQRYPSFMPVIPGHERLEDEVAIEALLRNSGYAGEIIVESFRVRALLTGPQIWEIVERVYPFGLLDLHVLEVVKSTVSERIGQLIGEDGCMSVESPLRCVIARV